MNTTSRNNLLVAKKDSSLITTGSLRSSGNVRRWTLKEGDMAFFDPVTLDILDPAAAFSFDDHPEIGLAVGYRNNQGELKVRMSAANKIVGDKITAVTCTPPSCGQDEAKDIMVDCVYSGEVYTIVVEVFDEEASQRTNNTNIGIPYKFSVTAEEVDSCTECAAEEDRLEQVLCALENKINTGSVSGVRPIGLLGEDRRIERQPFKAAKLKPYASLYTLTGASSGACVDCDSVTPILSFSEGMATITFTALNTMLEDGVITANEYVEEVVAAINAEPTMNVKATKLSNGQNCCGHKIEIMHCTDNLVVLVGEGQGTPLTETLQTQPLNRLCSRIEYCSTCSEEESAPPAGLPGGLRIYFNPVAYRIEQCGYVTWPKIPVSMGKVYASDRGYLGFTKWCVFDAHEAVWPVNLGWQWFEYELATDMDLFGRQNNAGIGSQYKVFDNEFPKRAGIATDPNEQYMSIIIEHGAYYESRGGMRTNKYRDVVIIPFENETLITDLVEAVNTYVTSIPGKNIPALTCLSVFGPQN